MLSKANAEIELFWAVHSEALVFCFTERPLVWTILKHSLSFPCALTFRHKSWKNSPIHLWHHYTKTPFWGCDNHFSRKEMCIFTEYIIQWWSSLTVQFCPGFETMNESVNVCIAGCKLTTSARIIFFFSLIYGPYNKQLNNFDRLVVTGKSQTSAYRIDLAIAWSIQQGRSLRFIP